MPACTQHDGVEEDESHQRISSFFLGPRAENFEYLKSNIIAILEEQQDTRLDYFPKDGKFITESIQASSTFRGSAKKISRAVRDAAHLLGKHSIPFWSPRYQGHMCMDLSMPAILGYFMTMLFNPNNVSIEASPITTVAEMEVGDDLCNLFGFNVDPNVTDRPTGWGHIVCDGTVANLESVWVARNLKFYPLSIRSAMKADGPLAFIADSFQVQPCIGDPKLLKDLTIWELLNIRPSDVLDIPQKLYDQYHISQKFLESVMQQYGIQSTSKDVLEKEFDVGPMKYFLANSRHYSWPKAGAVTGIGSDHMVGIQLDHGARVDMADLRAHLQESLDKKVAVYAVVAIVGSTEEGSVDPLADIIKIRQEFQKKGLSFLVHADGAWGGYFCTMLPKGFKMGDSVPLPSEQGSGHGFVPDASLRAKTTEDLFMIRQADSVTIDPHKAAYIPYPAGALCYRDGRMRFLITWTSPYISRGATTATSIGVFGIEGSKPGAAVMSTWFNHAAIGLHPEGYGRLFGEVVWTCSRLSAEWAAMSTREDSFHVVPLNELPSELKAGATEKDVEDEKQKIHDRVLTKSNEEIVNADVDRPHDDKTMALLRALGSDLNINAFSINWRYADGTLNEEVEEANYFVQRVIERLSVDSPEDEPTKIPFYLTSTTFMLHEYGQCAQHFKKRLGLVQDNSDLMVLRNVVMSPWATDRAFLGNLVHEFKKVMVEEVEVCRERNDISSDYHKFLLQGTNDLHAIHFPMFHLARHRSQFIVKINLDADALKAYKEARAKTPGATFIITTSSKEKLGDLTQKKTFKAKIELQNASRKTSIFTPDSTITITSVLKDRSLKARYFDTQYPSGYMPFYIYGSPQELHMDHILTRSPNVQLSASNVKLELTTLLPVPNNAFTKGAVCYLKGVQEAAMQPFPANQDNGFVKEEDFFFQPGQKFQVDIYADDKDAGATGPGLTDRQGSKLAEGSVTLGDGVYVDGYALNKDTFERVEGDEKFKKWKKVFDRIEEELK